MTDTHRIRAATPQDAAMLSELAFRSKAVWGYDAAFMAASRDDLTLRPADIAAAVVRVAERDDRALGFYRLCLHADEDAELLDLFVAPEAIRQGVGRWLWRDAVALARADGSTALRFQSDPHAEPFYLARGAIRIGESPSTVFAGRMLPLMRFVIDQD